MTTDGDTNRLHSRYSGSGAYRFRRCHGAPRLALTVPELPQSDEANDGERAHFCLKQFLDGNGWPPWIEAEMYRAVQTVLDYIGDLRKQHTDLVVLSEQRVFFPQNIVPGEDAAGWVDVACFSVSARKAWVIDFKYGVGEIVDVEANDQLRFYATGLLWGLFGARHDYDSCELVIIQPRGYAGDPIRTVVFTPWDMAEFQSDIVGAIALCEAPDARLTPGDWCRWCPAGVVCVAREKQAIAVMTGDTRPVQYFDKTLLPKPEDLDTSRLAYIMDHADQIRAWLREVEQTAFRLALSQTHIARYKIVESRGQRSWSGDISPEQIGEYIEIYAGLWKGQGTCRVPITITEAEAAVKARYPARSNERRQALIYLNNLMKRDKGGLSLVPETDPRPAWSRVETDFAGVTVDVLPSEYEATAYVADDVI